MMKVIGVIPARMGSTRLPGKPLKDICGKPMVWWVYQQARQVSEFEQLIIATDDKAIYNICKEYRLDVVMTSPNHPTAIHRLYEVSKIIPGDFYIQINGDEPLIRPEVIRAVVPLENMKEGGAWGVNAYTAVTNPVEVMDPTNIKLVFNSKKICTYMSRTPIPFPYKQLDFEYYKHIGIIGYTLEMLEFYINSNPGHLERIEGIDLLRFIDYGKKLYLVEVENCQSLSVDTEKDLEEVRRRISYISKM